MRNEIKIIIILGVALLMAILYITYTSGNNSNQINTDLRATISDLREYNRQAGIEVDASRELQRQFKELSESTDNLIRERDTVITERDIIKRERDEALKRLGNLVGVSEEISDSIRGELNEAFRIIDEGRESIRQVGTAN